MAAATGVAVAAALVAAVVVAVVATAAAVRATVAAKARAARAASLVVTPAWVAPRQRPSRMPSMHRVQQAPSLLVATTAVRRATTMVRA